MYCEQYSAFQCINYTGTVGVCFKQEKVACFAILQITEFTQTFYAQGALLRKKKLISAQNL